MGSHRTCSDGRTDGRKDGRTDIFELKTQLKLRKFSISIVFLCNSYRNPVCRVPHLLPRVANLKTSYLTPPSHLKETMKKWRGVFFSALKCHDNRCCASDRTRVDYEVLLKKYTKVQPISVGNFL